MRKKVSWKKIGLIVFMFVLLLGIGSVWLINSKTYSASPKAEIQSEYAIKESSYDVYSNGESNELGIIFYPGALVRKEAYSMWAKQLSETGVDVYIVNLPFNLAIFSQNAAQPIIDKHPETSFILSGHSLGGVVASRFTASHPDEVDGMIFMASYPDKKGDLSRLHIPTLCIWASEDGVINQEAVLDSKAYLPTNTKDVDIVGGNHAGFGSYGDQKGDLKASISNQQQQQDIAEIILDWIKRDIKVR